MDGSANVDADTAQVRDMGDNKDTTTPADGEEAVDMMRAYDQSSTSTEAYTAGPMTTVCT